ncbi:amidohydrolase family protein [uncultured Draconibacterium sp.]|uniref:amidohydrolase family protein n=1 Tax=uncultured Draconibacterium sp. TaxID=1573823 RepID=UPI0029C951E4|nr:amidohydrolase family protein [uncultured Draconibacterium sp.]
MHSTLSNNMTPNAKNRIEQQLTFLKANKNNLTIDADTHISDIANLEDPLREKYLESDNYYHGKPISAKDLMAEMNMAGVDMCLSWQNPATTVYEIDHEKNFEKLFKANQYIYDMATKYPDRIIPAGWTDPKNLGVELAIKMAEICVKKFGFFIVKMNPAQNEYPIDSDAVVSVFNKIIELGGVPAFHFGGDTPYTTAEGFEVMAKIHPEHPVIGVHMGGGGPSYIDGEIHYHKARELGLRMPNIKFIQSAKRDTHMESDFIAYELAGEPYSKNIFCASDAPYGRQSWNFGGFRLMFDSLKNGEKHTDRRLKENPNLFNENVAQNYLGRNFAEFTIDGYERLLKKYTK